MSGMFSLAIVFALLLIYEKRREITLMVYLQLCNNGSRFCTRRDKVGVNEDVKETVYKA